MLSAVSRSYTEDRETRGLGLELIFILVSMRRVSMSASRRITEKYSTVVANVQKRR